MHRDILFFDTETTGLLRSTECDLSQQPYITEICAIRTDHEFNQIGIFETFVKPPIPIPEKITQITGINDATVANAKPFPAIYDKLVEIFIGTRTAVAHNLSFDMGMLWAELSRMEAEYKFPWSPVWHCTVEKSMPIEHRRIKLGRLHEIATGSPHVGAHRARNDVLALITCYKWMRKKGFV